MTVARSKKKPDAEVFAQSVKSLVQGDQNAEVFAQSVKSLVQGDQIWEVDFRALPKPPMQSETQYLGLVINQKNGELIAQSQIEGRPMADDLSALLCPAMQRPLIGKAQKPSQLHIRGHRQWQELFPPLESLGIQISVRQELPKIATAYNQHLEQLRKIRRSELVKPNKKQAAVETLFPAIAEWVRGWGHIEIGDQENFGFIVRAIGYGGEILEEDKAETFAEALTALEHILSEHLERERAE